MPDLTLVLFLKQDPWQLWQIFGDLEEGNLSLIQTAQVALSPLPLSNHHH